MQHIKEMLTLAQRGERLSPSLSQIMYDEIPVLVINHPQCQAAVALQGGHLLFWQPVQTDYPVIWLSEQAMFKQGVAIRGGVPICWPWFNKLGGQPSHGFARTSMWQRLSHDEDENGVELVLHLQDSPQTREIWDHAFGLQLVLKLGRTCQIMLENYGEFTATAALHSYFGVDDINQVVISGLSEHYQESLTTDNPPAVKGEQRFDQAVDRIFPQTDATNLLQDSQRKVKISHLGASDVVVWNPWQQGAQAMQDMADEGYQQMVCIESARISEPMHNHLDASHHLGVHIELLD